MRLPKEIVTRHKIRDSKILSLYLNESETFESIAKRFDISATRVGQIIYKNRHLLKLDQQYEKIQRITRLKRILKGKADVCVTKDAVDVIDKLRIEAGMDEQSQGRGETKVIIIRESNANQNPEKSVSGSLSVLRV